MEENPPARLEWRDQPIGQFGGHYVAGEPVDCGDLLEVLLHDGAWALGRYEWNPRIGGTPTLDLGGDAIFITEELRLRRPSE